MYLPEKFGDKKRRKLSEHNQYNMTTQLPKEKFDICKTSNTFGIERVLQSNID